MRVSNGWNTDFGKVKFDVTLDEDDLRDMLVEHGLPADARLTVNEKFGILDNEGKAYAKFCLRRVSPDQAADLLGQVKQHKDARDAMLGKVARRLKEDGSEAEG